MVTRRQPPRSAAVLLGDLVADSLPSWTQGLPTHLLCTRVCAGPWTCHEEPPGPGTMFYTAEVSTVPRGSVLCTGVLLACLEYNFLTHLSKCVLEQPWATMDRWIMAIDT